MQFSTLLYIPNNRTTIVVLSIAQHSVRARATRKQERQTGSDLFPVKPEIVISERRVGGVVKIVGSVSSEMDILTESFTHAPPRIPLYSVPSIMSLHAAPQR
jgi:hypothetical protein